MTYGLFGDSEAEKRCAMCGRTLPVTRFHRSRQSADGLQCYCKDCQREYKRRHPDKEYKYMKKVSENQLKFDW